MTQADLDEVVKLELECMVNPWSRTIIEDLMGQFGTQYFVFQAPELLKGKIWGYLGYTQKDLKGHIFAVAVKPEYRNKYIGSQLVDYIVEYARRRSCDEIMLEFRSKDKGLGRFYEKLGFSYAGVSENYYGEPLDDAVLMRFKT
jgi:ribosomal-protein-alanine N-acetyltransferase